MSHEPALRELMAKFPFLSRKMGDFQCGMTARYNGYVGAQIVRHKVNEAEKVNDQWKGVFKKRNPDHELSECRMLSSYWRIPCLEE